ncbi:hypothetical protein ACQCVH_06680 [Bacillus infantis]|uniref:hypothetical protein n=1 Tax=Bacillus infantis TaxID=324767 RepID=UPI003CE74E90
MRIKKTTFGAKAINATTVEVKMASEVSADVKAADFTIDGLTVSNAAVKQTDKSTVVLTTSTQEAKEYTLKIKGETAGKFTGVSAVVPSKVELVSKSVQGKLGQEVTVKAQVTVADGQSKAGIPVTFNVPGDNGTLKDTLTKEVMTDENGVATYTYTRYASTTDTVTAYATGDRSKFSNGYVFWGVNQILTVEEVTTEDVINNGSNKTYKVKLTNPVTGNADANKTLNVSLWENINVSPDKVKDATVNGVAVKQLSNGSVTTAAQITTDSKGEATFTVSGRNTEVTPIVFEANNTATAKDYSYSASDLQATGSKVTFSAVQADYTIELTRDGDQDAAIGERNGRKYNVVVKSKDGKVAANEVVNVAFNEDLDRVISTNTSARFVEVLADGSQRYFTGSKAKQISVKTNSKGEASFVVSSEVLNDYATPVAWIDVNSPNAVNGTLDEGEPKTVAAISYFEAEELEGAKLATYNEAGEKTTDIDGDESASFRLALTNQSGKSYSGSYTIKSASWTVTNTGANPVVVNGQTISPNRSYTTSQTSNLVVDSIDGKTTSVKVVATGVAVAGGEEFAFTATESTAKFTNVNDVADFYTGTIELIDLNNEEIYFDGKANPVDYSDATFTGVSGKSITKEGFEQLLANDTYSATYQKDKDGKVSIDLVQVLNSTDTPALADFSNLNSAINNAESLYNNAVVGTDEGEYPQAAKDALGTAITNANAVADDLTSTQAQINTAVTNLNSAISTFEAAEVVVRPTAAATNPVAWATNATAGDNTLAQNDSFVLTFSEALATGATEAVENAVETALAKPDGSIAVTTTDNKSFTVQYIGGTSVDITGGADVTLAANAVKDLDNNGNEVITFTVVDAPVTP